MRPPRPGCQPGPHDYLTGALAGTCADLSPAIGQEGQMVDVHLSAHRTAAAAEASFRRAIGVPGVTPARGATDKAKRYPPALRDALPDTKHRCGQYLNNGLERDHGYLKQRLHPMHGFKQRAVVDTMARCHALIRSLQNGFSGLTAAVPRSLRLATICPQLAALISCSVSSRSRPSAIAPSLLGIHSSATSLGPELRRVRRVGLRRRGFPSGSCRPKYLDAHETDPSPPSVAGIDGRVYTPATLCPSVAAATRPGGSQHDESPASFGHPEATGGA